MTFTKIPPIWAASSIRRVFLESALDTLPHPGYMQRSLHLLLSDNRNYLHRQENTLSNASMDQSLSCYSCLSHGHIKPVQFRQVMEKCMQSSRVRDKTAQRWLLRWDKAAETLTAGKESITSIKHKCQTLGSVTDTIGS